MILNATVTAVSAFAIRHFLFVLEYYLKLHHYFLFLATPFAFENTNLDDWIVGLILLGSSLLVLCSCLVFMVKILNSVMKGNIFVHFSYDNTH